MAVSVRLLAACKDGHWELALALLEEAKDAADIDARDEDEDTPLHWACMEGHAEVAAALMDRGADIHARDRYQYTPLHWACKMRHAEVAAALMDRGADIDARDKDQYTPLLWACEEGLVELAAALVERGADPGTHFGTVHSPLRERFERLWCASPLSVAVYDNDMETIRNLLEEKNDSGHHAHDPNWDIGDGWTVVHAAAYLNRVESLRELVCSDRVDLNIVSASWGQTALHIACSQGHAEIVQLLCQCQQEEKGKRSK